MDLSKIKVGDHVVLRLKVREISEDGGVWLDSPFYRCSGAYGLLSANLYVVGHEPKPEPPLLPGERVTSKEWGGVVLTIIGIDDGWAWLRVAERNRITVPITDLERAP